MTADRRALIRITIERVEAPDPETVVVYGQGPSPEART